MGVLEWLGAHILGPLITLYRTIHNKPRPEIVIRSLEPTGGSAGVVDFQLVTQNVGTKLAWASVSATVGDQAVSVQPETVELGPQAPAISVTIRVPRPGLGELIHQFNSDTTLYGETLVVEVVEGKHRAAKSWREHVYTPEENRDRYEIQQREWRFARGEDTESDRRADHLAGLDERMEAKRARDENERYFEV